MISARSLLRCLAVVAGFCLPLPALGSGLSDFPVELDAGAGQIVHLDCAAPSSPGSLDGAFRFLELRDTGRWAPSAFIGIRDDARAGKFRVFITQAERGGTVVAGYDYVLDGRLVLRETLVRGIPRAAAVKITLTWTDSGKFSVSILGKPPKTVDTELRGTVLFAAASSAKVKFAFSTGSFL